MSDAMTRTFRVRLYATGHDEPVAEEIIGRLDAEGALSGRGNRWPVTFPVLRAPVEVFGGAVVWPDGGELPFGLMVPRYVMRDESMRFGPSDLALSAS